MARPGDDSLCLDAITSGSGGDDDDGGGGGGGGVCNSGGGEADEEAVTTYVNKVSLRQFPNKATNTTCNRLHYPKPEEQHWNGLTESSLI